MDSSSSAAKKPKSRHKREKPNRPPASTAEISALISKIYQADLLEWQGKLNGDGRQHRKLLLDRYNSIKRTRQLAGLETPELIAFDPEAHEHNLKKTQQKRAKTSNNNSNSNSSNSSNSDDAATDAPVSSSSSSPLLPALPPIKDLPEAEVLESLGLPPYQPCFDDIEAELAESYEQDQVSC